MDSVHYNLQNTIQQEYTNVNNHLTAGCNFTFKYYKCEKFNNLLHFLFIISIMAKRKNQ